MDRMFFKTAFFKGPSRDGHWKLAKAINDMMLSVGLLYNPLDLYLSLSNKTIYHKTIYNTIQLSKLECQFPKLAGSLPFN